MTRSELVERLHSRFPALTIKDVTAVVDVILGAIMETLAAGDRVEIRGFGVFHVNHRPPRVGRNPKSGERVDVPETYAPHFKPGKELRQRVIQPIQQEEIKSISREMRMAGQSGSGEDRQLKMNYLILALPISTVANKGAMMA